MLTLVEKMEANAAKRLALDPGVPPAQELGRYKNFMKVESHRLKILHRAGAGGREICRGRAALMDILLRYLWEASKSTLTPQALKEFPSLALIALGGFGRAELNPHSDIDFMFLHEGQVVAGSKPLPSLSKIMDGILYPLWDLGFKIGHSVRSISDCVQVANSDMQSKTSLIEARLIAGDKKLFEKFQKAVLTKCVEGYEDEYIAARVQDQAARHEKFGNSATMQEPNIKNGCGGLRDFQNLHWMAFFKYQTRSLAEMQARALISPTERKQLEAAYDFMLAVRNELHYQVNRPVDVLTKGLQPTVATHLGYTERSPSKRLELFMRDLYTHSRNIYLITRTLEERLALLPQPKKLPSLRKFLRSPFGQPKEQTMDGFKIQEGQIHYMSTRVFKDQPRRLMRVFLYAQQRGLNLHPDLAQLIRSEIALVNREFLKEEHVRETFLEIINQRGNVGRILRRMHEVDFLGKYIPEFGKLTCLVQHEFYHQYAADEHTLVCLEQLDRIWEAKEPPFNTYTELFQSLEKPFILYLAMLLHDAGKAQHDQKHSEVGGQLAMRVSRRLNLDGATTHALRLLIEQHLSMAMISQRRDLEDPAVIKSFAAQVQTPENLKMLTILTFADSRATSDKLWNGFKDALLWQLHHKTMQFMHGGVFINAEEKQRELLAQGISDVLPRSFGHEELEAHFAALPSRYFQITPEREIVTDLSLAHRFMHLQIAEEDKALEPVLVWHNEPDRGYTSVKICTWDRAGLFSKITGSLSAAGINILSAQIFTRADGIVLDTFFVTDALSGSMVSRDARDRFESLLFQTLSTSDEIDFRPLINRQKAVRPLYQSLEGERIPTRIHFDNETSETRTVIDVETEDRVGLLYVISQALTECKLDIALAKILTEKGAAIDTFYVCEVDTQKVIFPDRQKSIAEEIRAAIASLDK